jgi:hypothetical protein
MLAADGGALLDPAGPVTRTFIMPAGMDIMKVCGAAEILAL